MYQLKTKKNINPTSKVDELTFGITTAGKVVATINSIIAFTIFSAQRDWVSLVLRNRFYDEWPTVGVAQSTAWVAQPTIWVAQITRWYPRPPGKFICSKPKIAGIFLKLKIFKLGYLEWCQNHLLINFIVLNLGLWWFCAANELCFMSYCGISHHNNKQRIVMTL